VLYADNASVRKVQGLLVQRRLS